MYEFSYFSLFVGLCKYIKYISTIGGNIEMEQSYTTFSHIKLKSTQTENKERIKLHSFYCKIRTLF